MNAIANASPRSVRTLEKPRSALQETLHLEDDDLELDLGEGPSRTDNDQSIAIELGRDAVNLPPTDFSLDDPFKPYDDDLNLDIGDDGGPVGASRRGHPGDETRSHDDAQQDVVMEDFQPIMDDDQAPVSAGALNTVSARSSSRSHSSSPRASMDRELNESYRVEEDDDNVENNNEDEQARPQRRPKKRRVLDIDRETRLTSRQLNALQTNRSRITRPTVFLPRDPVLLTLQKMQKSGAFVPGALSKDGYHGLAPEICGLLSLEEMKTSGELKRKRDSGVADLGDDVLNLAMPDDLQIVIGSDPLEAGNIQPANMGGVGDEDTTFNQLPADEGLYILPDDDMAPIYNEDPVQSDPVGAAPDQSEHERSADAPATDAVAGVVSFGTKHAVHLLREHFDSQGGSRRSSTRSLPSVYFHDLLPERRTTKVDATKMFFEMLVLGTKDSVKIEQASDVVGGPIRVSGKKDLWASWAETQAGGELSEEAEPALAA